MPSRNNDILLRILLYNRMGYPVSLTVLGLPCIQGETALAEESAYDCWDVRDSRVRMRAHWSECEMMSHRIAFSQKRERIMLQLKFSLILGLRSARKFVHKFK